MFARSDGLNVKLKCLNGLVSHSSLLHIAIIDGLEWCGLL